MVTLCWIKNGQQLWERLPGLYESYLYMKENKISSRNEPFVFTNAAESSIILYEDVVDAVKRGAIKLGTRRVPKRSCEHV